MALRKIGTRKWGERFRDRQTEYLEDEDVLALLRATKTTTRGVRNRAIIYMMWRCGLRYAESMDLKISNVNLESQYVHVVAQKSKYPRNVPIPDDAIGHVQDWARIRSQYPKRQGHFFCALTKTRLGKRISDQSFYEALVRIAKRSGVQKRVNCLTLRHTFAINLVRKGVHLEHIRRVMGHVSLKTTQVYLTEVPDEDTLKVVLEAQRSTR